MYFSSRRAAGDQLADQLESKYRYENCAIMALDDGGVMVASEIAIRLHCVMTLLLTEPIELPREPDSLAAVDQSGNLTYNSSYTAGDIEDLTSEFRTAIEEQKIAKLHELNAVLGEGELIRESLLKNRHVIIVSDGLASTFSLDAAEAFLKPIKMESLIIATPLATPLVMDKMRAMAQEVYCLDVIEDYINTAHYYEKNDLPPHVAVLKIIRDIVLHWR